MADYPALRDAESLLAQADKLLAAIDREIAAMQAAVASAEESIARAEAAAREGSEHVTWLAGELERGREQQTASLRRLESLGALSLSLREQVLPWQIEPPAMAREAAAPGPAALKRAAVVPTFVPLTRARLEAVVPRPLQSDVTTWDLLAAEEKPFTERLAETLALLDEADAMIETREQTRAAQPEPAQPARRAQPKTETAKPS